MVVFYVRKNSAKRHRRPYSVDKVERCHVRRFLDSRAVRKRDTRKDFDASLIFNVYVHRTDFRDRLAETLRKSVRLIVVRCLSSMMGVAVAKDTSHKLRSKGPSAVHD